MKARKKKLLPTNDITTEKKELYFSGVKVYFPRTPFSTQLNLLNTLVLALKQGENALLESPTGTGKTLALLCGSLSYQIYNIQHQKPVENIERKSKTVDTKESKYIEICYELEAEPLNDGLKMSNSLPTCNEINEVKVSATPNVFIAPKRTKTTTTALPKPKVHVKTWAPTFHGKVIYASRTHSQLAQVVKEIKNLPEEILSGNGLNASNLKIAILGSRKLSCINEDVLQQEGSLDECCNNLVSNHHKNVQPQCKYYNNTRFISSNTLESANNSPMDIEDLKVFGRKTKTCPYFLSRQMLKSAHIILCPYNYLLEPSIRKATMLERVMKDSIVIIDEAHNVESVARDAYSIEISVDDLDGLKLQLDGYTKFGAPELYTNYTIFHDVIEKLSTWCRTVGRTLDIKRNREKKFSGVAFAEVMETKLDVNNTTRKIFSKSLKEILDFSNGKDLEGDIPNKKTKLGQKEVITSPIRNFLEMFFLIAKFLLSTDDKALESFAVCISISENNKLHFNIWCLTAKLVFADLNEKCKSILLASGTLAPLEAFRNELNIPFKFVMEGRHIVANENLIAVQQSFGLDSSTKLCSAFYNTSCEKYMSQLGAAILSYLRAIPGGVLVFFPSFTFLKKCINTWKQGVLLKEINKAKKAFSETLLQGGSSRKMIQRSLKQKSNSSGATLEDALKDYTSTIEKTNGAVFFCVFRGRLSEGIDFRDDQCRAVICVGIPFAPIKDPKIQLKKSYQDRFGGNFNGNMWYSQQAWRAVNQALGRVIRHKDDFGALIFLDSRFEQRSSLNCLSSWIRSSFPEKALSNGNALSRLKSFFASHSSTAKRKRGLENKENIVAAANQRKLSFFSAVQKADS